MPSHSSPPTASAYHPYGAQLATRSRPFIRRTGSFRPVAQVPVAPSLGALNEIFEALVAAMRHPFAQIHEDDEGYRIDYQTCKLPFTVFIDTFC